MKKFILALIALVLAVTLFSAMPAQAAGKHRKTQEKVGVCHRTASESNPYVFISVPKAQANGHITGDEKQHNRKVYWKSDGTWRGVAHEEGDLKLDYFASDEEVAAKKCFDTQPPGDPEDVLVTPEVTFVDECGTANDSVTGVVKEGYTFEVDQDGLTYSVTFVPEPGYDLNGDNPIVVTLTDVACPTPEVPTPPLPPVPPLPPTPEPEFKEPKIGANLGCFSNYAFGDDRGAKGDGGFMLKVKNKATGRVFTKWINDGRREFINFTRAQVGPGDKLVIKALNHPDVAKKTVRAPRHCTPITGS